MADAKAEKMEIEFKRDYWPADTSGLPVGADRFREGDVAALEKEEATNAVRNEVATLPKSKAKS